MTARPIFAHRCPVLPGVNPSRDCSASSAAGSDDIVRVYESGSEDWYGIGVSDLSLAVLNPNSCDYPQGPPSSAVTVESITPNSGSIGSLIPVTITGTGFADGMSVSFENGSGARLSVTDVVVVNESTITATVTIRKRGQGNDNVWDVRVGDAVLADGFIVTR